MARQFDIYRIMKEAVLKNMSTWFLRLATLYLVAGVSLGLFMAASHDHAMHPVHAHLNLLGFVLLTLFGLFYRAFPAATETLPAKLHFGIYVPAHFVQMILLTLLYSGNPGVEPALAAASMLVGVAILCFAVTVWKNTKLAS